MKIETNGFELGDEVRDTVTGLKGKVIAFHQYLTGCARASVQPPVNKEGAVPDSVGVDVLVLEMVKKGPNHIAEPEPARKGGPRLDPHSRV